MSAQTDLEQFRSDNKLTGPAALNMESRSGELLLSFVLSDDDHQATAVWTHGTQVRCVILVRINGVWRVRDSVDVMTETPDKEPVKDIWRPVGPSVNSDSTRAARLERDIDLANRDIADLERKIALRRADIAALENKLEDCYAEMMAVLP